jgi:hypothetical protein
VAQAADRKQFGDALHYGQGISVEREHNGSVGRRLVGVAARWSAKS